MDLSRVVADLAVLCLFMVSMAVILIGWGRLLFRLVDVDAPVVTDMSSAWLGFVVVLSVVEVVHFFVQIDWMVTSAVAVFGSMSFLVSLRKSDTEACIRSFAFLFSNRIYVLSAIVFSAIAICRAMDLPGNYDSGLYHFGSIKWLNEAPMIPGLANVHMRFGFNQSYFGFLALSNLAPYWNRGYAAGGLFLLLLTVMTIVQVGLTQSRHWRLAFFSCLFIYVAAVAGVIANPTPDTAIDLLEICIFIYLARLVHSSDKQKSTLDAMVILILCVAASMVKLSSVAFVFCCCAIVVVLSLKHGYLARRVSVRIIMVMVVMISLHVLRGLLLSGVPLFPNPLFAQFSMPWAVSFGVPQYESLLIYSWARTPSVASPQDVVLGWDWFLPWLHRLSVSTRITFLFAGFSVLLNVWLSWRKKEKRTTASACWLYFVIFSALTFWFFTAPDPRFLGPILFLQIAFGMWQFLESYSLIRGNSIFVSVLNESRLAVVVFVISGAIVLKLSAGGLSIYPRWRELPTVKAIKKITDYGLSVNAPEAGESCWDSDLPCTPYFNGNLHQVQVTLPFFGTPIQNRYYFSVIPKQ